MKNFYIFTIRPHEPRRQKLFLAFTSSCLHDNQMHRLCYNKINKWIDFDAYMINYALTEFHVKAMYQGLIK